MESTKGNPEDRTGKPWSDAELRASLEAYFFLLKLQKAGVSFPEQDFYHSMLSGPLAGRSEASVRYRMRNLSFVFSELNLETLDRFSPASQIGPNIKARVLSLISEYEENSFLFSAASASSDARKTDQKSTHENILRTLDSTEEKVNALLEEFKYFGHNQPPAETLDNTDPKLLLNDIKRSISSVKTGLHSADYLKNDLQTEKNALATASLQLLNWVGGRVTKFTDAALITVAPLAVAHIMGLIPNLVQLVTDLQKLIGTTF